MSWDRLVEMWPTTWAINLVERELWSINFWIEQNILVPRREKTDYPLADRVVEAFADADGLTEEECKALGIDEDQTQTLTGLLNNNAYVSLGQEDQLRASNFSPQFIRKLLGYGGARPAQERIKWFRSFMLSGKGNAHTMETFALKYNTMLAHPLLAVMNSDRLGRNVRIKAMETFAGSVSADCSADTQIFPAAMSSLLSFAIYSDADIDFRSMAMRNFGYMTERYSRCFSDAPDERTKNIYLEAAKHGQQKFAENLKDKTSEFRSDSMAAFDFFGRHNFCGIADSALLGILGDKAESAEYRVRAAELLGGGIGRCSPDDVLSELSKITRRDGAELYESAQLARARLEMER